MEAISAYKDTLDMTLQLLLIVLPVLMSWFVRIYVKHSTAEKQIAAITRLANAAIDYVEDMDRRGDMALTPGVRKGVHKLELAAEWMEAELQRNGIKISTDQASSWIASEFQKRIGDGQSRPNLAEQAKAAVDLVQTVEGERFSRLLEDPPRLAFLARFAADWMVSRSGAASVTRSEALSWIHAEILQRLQPNPVPAGGSSPEPAAQAIDQKQNQPAVGLRVVSDGRLVPAAQGGASSG